MEAGKLRHRIGIEKQVNSQNETTGEMVVSWLTLADVWGEFSPLSVRELLVAQSQKSAVQARVRIRYRDDIDASMRIVFRGKHYNIAGVLADADSGLDYLTLPLIEGLNDGR